MTEDIVAVVKKEMAGKPTGERIIVEVGAEDIKTAATALFKEYQPRFVTLVAVDNGLDIELKDNFSINGQVATLSTLIPKESNQIHSITKVFPAAEFIEKEVAELFGLSFAGHPREVNLVLTDELAAKKPLARPMTGSLPVPARFEVPSVLLSGSAIGVLKSATDKREKEGLPELPIASASEDSIKEYQELIKRSGFGERAGYDWEKGKLRYR